MKKIALFLNNSGENELSIGSIKHIHKIYPDAEIHLVSLAEDLPAYSRFPSEEKKERIEEMLSKLSSFVLKDATEKLGGVKVQSENRIEGRLPEALVNFCNEGKFDLLVKQPLLDPDMVDSLSKGDTKLLRNLECSVFIAREDLDAHTSVLCGLDCQNDEDTKDPLNQKIISTSINFCKDLGGSTHIVHAWRMVGQEILQGRVSKEEFREALSIYEEIETKAFKNYFETVGSENSDCKFVSHIYNGTPNRVLPGIARTVQPSLVVLGSVRGSTIQNYLLGSTAESFAKTQPYSLLIVK